MLEGALGGAAAATVKLLLVEFEGSSVQEDIVDVLTDLEGASGGLCRGGGIRASMARGDRASAAVQTEAGRARYAGPSPGPDTTLIRT